MKNKVLIITGGQVVETLVEVRVLKEQYTMIIAADHGLIIADHLNLPLDYIVGDFDSVSDQVLEKYRDTSVSIITYPKEKDKTDTHIAIELAISKKATQIDILGATGNRFDHVLANLHLLLIPLQNNIEACIIDFNNKIYLKEKSFQLKKELQYGNYISLMPFTDLVKDLTLKGFKYPLNHVLLTSGSSLGISNEIVEEEAVVEFNDGILIVIEAKD